MPAPRFHPFARLVICLLGAVAAATIVVVVIVVALTTAAGITGLPANEQISRFFNDNAVLVTLLVYPSILLWLWFCRRAIDRRSFVSLGLRRRRCLRDLAWGMLAGAGAISLLFGILYLSGNLRIDGWSPEAFAIGPLPTTATLLAWAGIFLVLGFMEEITFRGYALHNLTAWLGVTGAVIFQALVFALVHLGNVATGNPAEGAWADAWRAMPNLALIGAFFALCYLKTGSLWFPVGFHGAWNFFLGSIFSLPVSSLHVFRLLDIKTSPDHLLTGGSFGAEGSLFLLVINLVLIYLMVQQEEHPQARLDLALLTTPAAPLPHPTPPVSVSDSLEAETLSHLAPLRGVVSLAGTSRTAPVFANFDLSPRELAPRELTTAAPPAVVAEPPVLEQSLAEPRPVEQQPPPPGVPVPSLAAPAPAPPVRTAPEPSPAPASKPVSQPAPPQRTAPKW